jgi:hypothetical protein
MDLVDDDFIGVLVYLVYDGILNSTNLLVRSGVASFPEFLC